MTQHDAPSDSRSQVVVPYLDLAAQNEPLSAEMEQAMANVVRQGDFILGQETERFEQAFASFIGVDHAIGTGNGLDALRLSLTALKVGVGDEVIVPVNTFIATALAVSATGARPVFVDCDQTMFNLDPQLVESAISQRCKAIIPVHLTGQPADMRPLLEIAQRHDLHVIEDVAQAAGASYEDRRCGSFGVTGCFSFYPAKNFGALGDGGLVTTNDQQLAEQLRRLRNYGQTVKYVHDEKGWNSRLDTLQAAVLNIKLPYLDQWNTGRERIATRYREQLTGIGDLILQEVIPNARHVYHLFVVQTQSRDELREYLESRGIETLIHYPQPIHMQRAYRELGYKDGDFPVAERLAKRSLSLPIYPELKSEHVDYVTATIQEWFNLQ